MQIPFNFGLAPRSNQRARRYHATRRTPVLEPLEGRQLMAGDVGLDPTFHTPDGKVLLDFNYGNIAGDVMVQPDGRIVVAGTVNRAGGGLDLGVERLTTDGFPDPTFGTRGLATIAFDSGADLARGLVLQPDGRIVVYGSAGGDFAVARLTADGLTDPSFGTGGRVVIPFDRGGSNRDEALQASVLADGRIIVSGIVTLVDPFRVNAGTYEVGLARLNGDGTPDASFGAGGKTTIGLGGSSSTPTALAVAPDGRIIIAGEIRGVNLPATAPNTGDIQIARVRADGSIDTNFGLGGLTTVDFGGYDQAGHVAVLADGRIAIGGQYTPFDLAGNPAFAQLTGNGRPDSTFDGDGKFILPTVQPFYLAEMTVLADGRIVGLLGMSSFGSSGIGVGISSIGAGIIGLAADGTPDPVYLRAAASFGDTSPLITRFAIQPFGGILALGSTTTLPGVPNNIVARLAPTSAPIGDLLDRTPPQLVAAQAVFAGKGRHRKLIGVTLSFDEALDPATVTADRFRLGVVVHRSRGKVTTRPLRITAVSYGQSSGSDPATRLVTIRVAGKAAIPRGARVVIRPGLADTSNNATGTQIITFVD